MSKRYYCYEVGMLKYRRVMAGWNSKIEVAECSCMYHNNSACRRDQVVGNFGRSEVLSFSVSKQAPEKWIMQKTVCENKYYWC